MPRPEPRHSRPVVPVLIQVPTLATARGPKRPTAAARRRPSGKRRRLRREVRMTGYAALMFTPLLLASALCLGGRSTVSLASSRAPGPVQPCERRAVEREAMPPAPAISITVEPSAPVPVVDAEPPVVFPGYLLPDDDCEVPSHAGS